VAIERIARQRGHAYRVKWRDDHGRQRSKTFPLKRDADAYEAKIKLAKRQGDLGELDAGRERLEDFIAEWWRLDAEPRLADSTRAYYAWLRDKHIVPRIGHLQLRGLRPEVLQRFQTELLKSGAGQVTTRKTMVLLQGILERAVEWGRLPRNPVRSIKNRPRRGQGTSHR
jgi:integrase-like protein